MKFSITSNMQTQLTRTVFSFGSPCAGAGQYGHMVLRMDGSIYGYNHQNERRWSLVDKTLRFHAEDGAITSQLDHAGNNIWSGHVACQHWPLYLIPLIQLNARETDNQPEHAPIFVNSIPKSGTYYIETALTHVGVRPQRLHFLGRDIVDDYRNAPDAEMHRMPEYARLRCPLFLLLALYSSEHSVGHVEHSDVIEQARNQGVFVITLVRDLRAVLQSLFHFKRSRVNHRLSDRVWREAPDNIQFYAFLHYFYTRDIDHIAKVAECILDNPGDICLRYERLSVCTPEQLSAFDKLRAGFSSNLCAALRHRYGRASPTLSQSLQPTLWNDDAEQFFAASGLADLNRRLGYN